MYILINYLLKFTKNVSGNLIHLKNHKVSFKSSIMHIIYIEL